MKHSLRKETISALEKVFNAEINGLLPFQSKAKIYTELVDGGYLEPLERTFGSGPFAAIAKGYQLTHAGLLAYCSTCEDK